MDYHLDNNGGENNQNILSCIFTFKSPDCSGGELNYSNEECGGSYVIDSQKYEKYFPPDNSFYFFYGSYVKHSVSNVQIGIRYAVVFFLESIKSIEYIRLHWSKTIQFDKQGEIIKNVFCCEICDKSYDNKNCMEVHASKNKHIIQKQIQYRCNECLKFYGSRKSLTNHINKKHKKENIVRKYKCGVIDCEKSYDLIESLNDHKRKKHKIFKWK